MKTYKPWEHVAVDIIYKDLTKEPLSIAVIHRNANLVEWLDEHMPRHKMPADIAMIYTYNVTLH